MKKIFMAAGAMAGIIVVQMLLSYGFTWRVGEIFSEVSVGVLFFYMIFRLTDRRLKTEK